MLVGKDVLVQSAEGFLDAGEGGSQIHADVAGTMELTTVLPGDADIPASLLQLKDGLVVFVAPLGTVQKEHISALGSGNLYACKMLCNIVTGIVYILGQNLPQFIYPHMALRFVGTDQSMHA